MDIDQYPSSAMMWLVEGSGVAATAPTVAATPEHPVTAAG
jgi:hypothetical protein